MYPSAGPVSSWNLVETLRVNLATAVIISVCGLLFLVAVVAAIIVISHRLLSSSASRRGGEHGAKQSPASHHQLLYDQAWGNIFVTYQIFFTYLIYDPGWHDG